MIIKKVKEIFLKYFSTAKENDYVKKNLTQHLEQPISVHMQKKLGELGQN